MDPWNKPTFRLTFHSGYCPVQQTGFPVFTRLAPVDRLGIRFLLGAAVRGTEATSCFVQKPLADLSDSVYLPVKYGLQMHGVFDN